MTDAPPHRRNVSMVFQDASLYPWMSVVDNLAFPLKMARHKRDDVQRRVDIVIEQLGLRDLSERYPDTLSGGEYQRVALARAMIREPDVFLSMSLSPILMPA